MIEDNDDEVGPEIDDIIPIRRKPRWRKWVDNIGYTALGVGLATLFVVGLVNIFDGPLSETVLGLAARQAFMKAPWLKRLSFIKRTTPKVYVRPPVTVSGQQPTKTLSDLILDANRKIIKKYPGTKLQPMESLTNQALKNTSVKTRVQLENSMNPLRQRGTNEDLIKRILEAGNAVDDSVWGKPTIPGKQFGGKVSEGEPVVIGEIEPELFIPTQDGVIVPGSGRQKVLVINNGGTIQKVPVGGGGGGGNSTPTPVTTDVYSNLAKYAQFTSLLTV